jgi:hypothetical protein
MSKEGGFHHPCEEAITKYFVGPVHYLKKNTIVYNYIYSPLSITAYTQQQTYRYSNRLVGMVGRALGWQWGRVLPRRYHFRYRGLFFFRISH